MLRRRPDRLICEFFKFDWNIFQLYFPIMIHYSTAPQFFNIYALTFGAAGESNCCLRFDVNDDFTAQRIFRKQKLLQIWKSAFDGVKGGFCQFIFRKNKWPSNTNVGRSWDHPLILFWKNQRAVAGGHRICIMNFFWLLSHEFCISNYLNGTWLFDIDARHAKKLVPKLSLNVHWDCAQALVFGLSVTRYRWTHKGVSAELSLSGPENCEWAIVFCLNFRHPGWEKENKRWSHFSR